MGTNYYAKINTCQLCKRAESTIHIGKSSGGWRFAFQAVRDYESPFGEAIDSYAKWREVLSGDNILICDEYDREISSRDFFAMVDEKQRDKKNICHYDYMQEHHKHYTQSGTDFLDAEGYDFTWSDFS